MRKGEKFVWNEEREKSIEELKPQEPQVYFHAARAEHKTEALEAQKEGSEIWTIVENLDKQVEFRLDDDNVLWQDTRSVVPNDVTLREALLTEAHSLPFSVHPGSTKMYHDLKQYFWWSGMKRDVATFVARCLIWLPQTQRRHDAIWVVVDRLTKSAHFLPIRKDYPVSRLAEIFQQEIVRLHDTPSAIVSNRDPRFASHFWKGLQKAWGTRLKFSTAFHPQTDGQSERTIQTLEDMLRSCALEWTGNWDDYICLVVFAYNNSWYASITCVLFEMLYGRKCRAPICWDQVGERAIEGPEMIEVTNAKVAIIMANVPRNDPNVDAPAIVPAPVNPDHAPAQPVEEDAKEEEEDPEEEPKDDDDDMEMDDEAEVIDPYMDDGSNNPPPPNSEDEETPPTSPVIPNADGMVWKRTMPPRKSTRGNPPPPLTQDTVNRMIQESVEAAIRTERERVQNEANRAEGPNVAPVARECTFADFMKCSPITFCGNKGR
nr:putative reverse transcriptase domain-containing protein [Tanacetum cinerariifolium]